MHCIEIKEESGRKKNSFVKRFRGGAPMIEKRYVRRAETRRSLGSRQATCQDEKCGRALSVQRGESYALVVQRRGAE